MTVITPQQRLAEFVSKCDAETERLHDAISELQIDTDHLSKIIDRHEDAQTKRLVCMKLKLAAMKEYAAVLSDIDHIAQ